jgi:hypothetical protein
MNRIKLVVWRDKLSQIFLIKKYLFIVIILIISILSGFVINLTKHSSKKTEALLIETSPTPLPECDPSIPNMPACRTKEVNYTWIEYKDPINEISLKYPKELYQYSGKLENGIYWSSIDISDVYNLNKEDYWFSINVFDNNKLPSKYSKLLNEEFNTNTELQLVRTIYFNNKKIGVRFQDYSPQLKVNNITGDVFIYKGKSYLIQYAQGYVRYAPSQNNQEYIMSSFKINDKNLDYYTSLRSKFKSRSNFQNEILESYHLTPQYSYLPKIVNDNTEINCYGRTNYTDEDVNNLEKDIPQLQKIKSLKYSRYPYEDIKFQDSDNFIFSYNDLCYYKGSYYALISTSPMSKFSENNALVIIDNQSNTKLLDNILYNSTQIKLPEKEESDMTSYKNLKKKEYYVPYYGCRNIVGITDDYVFFSCGGGDAGGFGSSLYVLNKNSMIAEEIAFCSDAFPAVDRWNKESCYDKEGKIYFQRDIDRSNI